MNKKSGFLSPEENLRLRASLNATPTQPEYVHRNVCVPHGGVIPRPKCHALDNYANLPKHMSPEQLKAGIIFSNSKKRKQKPLASKKKKPTKPVAKKTWTARVEEAAQKTVKLDLTIEAQYFIAVTKKYNKQFTINHVSPAKEVETNKAFFDAGQEFHTAHQKRKDAIGGISMSGELFNAYELWKEFCKVYGTEFSQNLGEEKT